MIRLTRHKILILVSDFVIALFAFGILYQFGKLPYWYYPVLSALLWVILGVISQKLRFSYYKRMWYAWMGIFLQTVFAGFLIFLLYRLIIPGWQYHYSMVTVLVITILLEVLLYALFRRFVYQKIPYFYEEPVLDDVQEKGVNPLEDKKEAPINGDVEKNNIPYLGNAAGY